MPHLAQGCTNESSAAGGRLVPALGILEDMRKALSATVEKFSQLLAAGHSNCDAYRLAYRVDDDAKPKWVYEQASRLRNRPEVIARVGELLRESGLVDLDSPGQAWRRTYELMADAWEQGNHTAARGANQDLLRMAGMLRDRTVFSLESSESDEGLLRQLAGDDPLKLAAARQLLGSPAAFEELKVGPVDED